MKISREGVLCSISLILIAGYILSIPSSIIFRLEVGGAKFSASYLFLLAFISLTWIGSFTKALSLSRRPIFFLLLLQLLLLCFLAAAKGIELPFLISTITFCTSAFFASIFAQRLERMLPAWLLGIAFFASIAGIALYFLKIPLIDFDFADNEDMFLTGNGYFRAMSIFLNPNAFGYYLLCALCFLIPRILLFRDGKRAYWMALSAVFLYALYLSESSSSMLAFGMAVLFAALARLRSANAKILILASLLSLVPLAFLLTLAFPGAFSDIDVRFERWNVGVRYLGMHVEFLLAGMPLGGSARIGEVAFSDNLFIFYVLTAGIAGASLFIAIVLVHCACALEIIATFRQRTPAQASHALFVLASLVPMFLSHYILFHPIALLLGISYGIVAGAGNIPKPVPLKNA